MSHKSSNSIQTRLSDHDHFLRERFVIVASSRRNFQVVKSVSLHCRFGLERRLEFAA